VRMPGIGSPRKTTLCMMIRKTKMNETSSIVLSLLAGVLFGTIFFGGLWWTVRRGLSSKSPALLFVGSLFLRTIITVAGFYFVSHGDWRRLLACLLGLLLARVVVTRLTRTPMETRVRIVEEGGR
jgi:F1F0 ATPase subunit 2